MATLKHGIIGTGGMAKAHARQFNGIRGVALHACYDIDPERAAVFAQKHAVKHAVGSVDDLLTECDSVSIVTPDAFHAELSLQTLKAGKHLLCEKPLTTNLADARKVARAAQRAADKHGVIHMINFSYRDAPAFQQGLKIAASGKLGKIRHVEGKYLQSWLTSTMWGDWQTNEAWQWRCAVPKGGSAAAGGTLGDIGCHILDFTTGIAGDLAALRCSLRTFPKVSSKTGEEITAWNGYRFRANDSVLLELDFAEGGFGVIHSSRWATGHPNQVALGVYGTEGALEIDLEKSNATVRHCLGKKRHGPTGPNNTVEWTEQPVKPTPSNYQRFVKGIKTGKQDQADLFRGAQIQAYLESAEQSALNDGKPVKIPKWM